MSKDSKDGFILLLRKLVDWEWYHDSHMVHLFIHCLIRANFEDDSFQGHKVLRGQFVGGLKTLSSSTGMSEQVLRTCLKKLKLTNEITIKSTNRFSIITVCKYDSYQTKKKSINKQNNSQLTLQLTNNQHSTNIESTTSNNNTNNITTKQSEREGRKKNHTQEKNENGILGEEPQNEEIKNNPLVPVISDSDSYKNNKPYSIEEFEKYMTESKIKREEACMSLHITDNELSEYIEKYIGMLRFTEKDCTDKNEVLRYFRSWTVIEIAKNKKSKKNGITSITTKDGTRFTEDNTDFSKIGKE